MLKRSALIALAAVATIGLATLNAGDASAKSGNGGNGGHDGHHGHHHHHHNHLKFHFAYKQWHRYSVVRPVVATTAYTRPTCTCLTKEYLPNGAVLFKDVCTNEAAINPPGQAAQTTN